MTNETPEVLNYPEEANAVLTELLGLKTQADTLIQNVEEANRKANSESGYAFNAKQNAEEHAKAIAQLRGTVEADFNWLTTTKTNADAAAAAVIAAKTAAESDARFATEAKTAAETELAAIRGRKEQAEGALSAAEKARDEAAAFAKRTGDDNAVVTQAKATVEANASTVQALHAQVTEAAAKTQADAISIATRQTESQGLLTSMTEVTETAKATQARVAVYEAQLKELSEDFATLHSKIEGLLPGATSAGLASAFRDQKARFTGPQRIWLLTFIATMVILLIVAIIDVQNLLTEPATWDAITRHTISRLPVAIPLIWLALYSGRHYTLALRLQEDYAYKEAVSTAFEGYRREMASIPGANEHVPILTLSQNVLQTLAQRPGRLYDGKHDDITPLSPLAKLVKSVGRGGRRATDNSTEPTAESTSE